MNFRIAMLCTIALASSMSVWAQAGSGGALRCVANAGVPPTARAEGLTELVSDVTLNCTGGTPTLTGQQVPIVLIQVAFMQANVAVPQSVTPSAYAPVILSAGGATSAPWVTMSVRQ